MPKTGTSQSPDFKTLFLSVRSPRAAVFVNIAEPDWQELCLRIIEYFSSVWGGEHHLIVPTDGASLSLNFWNLLEGFDPDYLSYYAKSGRDIRLQNEARFNDLVESEVKKFAAAHSGVDDQFTRRHIAEMLEERRADSFTISPALGQELKSVLAPFHFREHVVGTQLRAGIEPAHHFTAVHNVFPYIPREGQIVESRVSIPGVPDLWLNCKTGRYTPSYKKKLEGVCNSADRVYSEEDSLELIKTVMNSQSVPYSPFAASVSGMTYYTSRHFQDFAEPAIVVVGNSLRDFCLYHGLSRLRHRVSWLLPEWIETFVVALQRAKNGGASLQTRELFASHFGHELLTMARMGGSDRQTVFVSESMRTADVKVIVRGLEEALLAGEADLTDGSQFVESVAGLLQYPKMLYERENAGKPFSYQFINRTIAGFLETPKPRSLNRLIPGSHRWVTEFTVKEQAYQRHPSLGQYVVPGVAGANGARSGANGFAYDCPNWMTFGVEMDAILVKPRVFLPNALETIEHLSSQVGLQCKPSDKGNYLRETIRKFDGLKTFGEFLKDPQKHALLNKYLDTDRPGRGIHDEGVFLRERRYLNFASIEKIIGDRQRVKALLDFLIPRGILQRGLIFQCELCRGADWYAMDAVTEKFRCNRCSEIQLISSRHWREPEEPAWFYKLDEIVYLAHYNNSAVGALALHYMEQRKVESFMYTTDLEFSQTGDSRPELEIDISCVQDGQPFLGEAKKENCLGDNAAADSQVAQKYLDLAKKLQIGNVLFATLAEEWSARTMAEIKRVFSSQRVQLKLLQGPELLG